LAEPEDVRVGLFRGLGVRCEVRLADGLGLRRVLGLACGFWLPGAFADRGRVDVADVVCLLACGAGGEPACYVDDDAIKRPATTRPTATQLAANTRRKRGRPRLLAR
jgi:hypothetical protein